MAHRGLIESAKHPPRTASTRSAMLRRAISLRRCQSSPRGVSHLRRKRNPARHSTGLPVLLSAASLTSLNIASRLAATAASPMQFNCSLDCESPHSAYGIPALNARPTQQHPKQTAIEACLAEWFWTFGSLGPYSPRIYHSSRCGWHRPCDSAQSTPRDGTRRVVESNARSRVAAGALGPFQRYGVAERPGGAARQIASGTSHGVHRPPLTALDRYARCRTDGIRRQWCTECSSPRAWSRVACACASAFRRCKSAPASEAL